jgi:ribosome-binding factor A
VDVVIMPTIRQEKVARVIREVVCDAVANRLNDPRIEGFASVMKVDVAADLRTASVYISIFGCSDAAQNKTFAALIHARSRIQSLLANKLRDTKFCPVLRLFKDEEFKKTQQTMKLIDQAASEFKKKESDEQKSDS